MKNYFYILIFVFGCLSCDPDVVGEKITLPDMNFNVNLAPDTAYLKIGDTLRIRSSLNTNYSGNNINLTEGEPLIGAYIGYYRNETYPITNADSVEQALENNQYKIILSKGRLKYNSSKPLILGFIPQIYNDSFLFDAKIVFNKVGLYSISLSSNIYESNQGKARTNARFIADNLNWQYYSFPDAQNPSPTEEKYYRRYSIAITE